MIFVRFYNWGAVLGKFHVFYQISFDISVKMGYYNYICNFRR